MTLATDKRPYQPPPETTAAALLDRREQILLTWVNHVRQAVSSARNEERPIIVDTLPAFLENLAQALDTEYPRELATEGTTIATEHGGERARVTLYSPRELIREYQLLRDTILEALEDRNLDAREYQVVVKSIDHAMGESLTAYFLVHQGIREQFTASLTHDLRSPLTAIKATADLMLRHPNRSDQVPYLAARIVENVRRIDRMIQDLLDSSRVAFGEKLRFEVEKCELLSLIDGTLAELATIHGERFAIDGNPIHGYWNPDAFKRAVENLVSNAIKYGDPVKPILVRLQEIQARAIVSVRNEGPYIPAEEQENLFKSFMRSQAARNGNRSGWGIGLAMVRGMAEGHGGSVTVDSAPGRGTTFIIDVPLDSRPHLSHPVTPGTGPAHKG